MSTHDQDEFMELVRQINRKEPTWQHSVPVFEFVADADKPIDWIVEDIWPENGQLMVFGKWGSGKSYVMLDIALHLAFGLPDWHGHAIPEARRVLYIPTEGRFGLKRRMVSWMKYQHQLGRINLATIGETDEFGAPLFIYGDNVWLHPANEGDESYQNVLAEVARNQVEIVILDVLSDAAPGVDENSREFGHVVKMVTPERIGTNGVGLVHHSGHSAKDRARGHSSIEGVLDIGILLESRTTGAGAEAITTITAKNKKMREADLFHAFTLTLTKPDDTYLAPVVQEQMIAPLAGPFDDFNLSGEQIAYVLAVRDLGDNADPKTIADRLDASTGGESSRRKRLEEKGILLVDRISNRIDRVRLAPEVAAAAAEVD